MNLRLFFAYETSGLLLVGHALSPLLLVFFLLKPPLLVLHAASILHSLPYHSSESISRLTRTMNRAETESGFYLVAHR